MAKAKKKRPAGAKRKAAKRAVVEQKVVKNCAPPAPPVTRPSPVEEAAYTQTVIATGEAARPDKEGKLPAGATHKIIEDEAGDVKVVRRRFSMTD